jgi:hypothetical protein
MYYLRTPSDEQSIKGLWFDLDKAKESALKHSKELKAIVVVMSVDTGRSVYNTQPTDFK